MPPDDTSAARTFGSLARAVHTESPLTLRLVLTSAPTKEGHVRRAG